MSYTKDESNRLFQIKGNYALRSELARYQPKGNYVTTIQAANFATKGDLGNYYTKPESDQRFQLKGDYALKSEIPNVANFQPKGDYALQSELAAFQPKGDFALKSELAAFQPKGDYAIKSEIPSVTNFALKSELAAFQPKGDYALKSEIPSVTNFALKSEIAAFQPKGDYALKSEIPSVTNFATKGDITAFQPKGDYALKSELAAFQPKGDYALKSEIPNVANFQPKGDYALKSEIPNTAAFQPANFATKGDIANFALKSDLAAFQPKGDYALKSEIPNTANFQPGNIRGDMTLGAGTASNSWLFHAPDDTRGLLSVAPIKDGNPQWHLAPQFFNNGNANIQGNLNVQGKFTVAGKEISGSGLVNGSGVPITDTRNVNSSPNAYYRMGRGVYREFKEIKVIELNEIRNVDFILQGIKASPGDINFIDNIKNATYCHLETIVNWNDFTGGPIYQYAHCPEGRYVRISNPNNTWNRWSDNINLSIIANIERVVSQISTGPSHKVFSKNDKFEDPAVQIGADNVARDTNIYSLSFGQAQGGTYMGMGRVPNDKKMFPNTTGPVLGTHIKATDEWGLFSDGWNKLFAVQGGSGNVRSRGDISSGADVLLRTNTTKNNSWILHAPDDDRGLLSIAPVNNGAPQWNLAGNFYKDGRLIVPKLCLADGQQTGGSGNARWCIQDEGGVLVFRDTKSPDSRYAMFNGRYVDLTDPINNNQRITIRSDKNGQQRRLQRADDEVGRFVNNNTSSWEQLFIEKN